LKCLIKFNRASKGNRGKGMGKWEENYLSKRRIKREIRFIDKN